MLRSPSPPCWDPRPGSGTRMRLPPTPPGSWSIDGMRPVVDRLRTRVAIEGGCTLSRRSGRALSRGIAVCAAPGDAWDFPAEDWNDRLVSARIVALTPVLEARDAHLGAWLDPCSSRVWIEPVWVLPAGARSAAEAIG